MDARNDRECAGRQAINYWRDVALYIGGTEHAVGHLMYSRFWHKFLFDKGLVPTVEPFRRLVNQGMIQGVIPYLHVAAFVKAGRVGGEVLKGAFSPALAGVPDDLLWVSADTGNGEAYRHRHLGDGFLLVDEEKPVRRMVPLGFSRNVKMQDDEEYRLYRKDIDALQGSDNPDGLYFRSVWEQDSRLAIWKTDKSGEAYLKLSHEFGKMSKSKYNVVNPDDIVDRYGADCFRMYEMFLGPIDQAKPWDTNGIDGVSKFLRRFWSLFFDEQGNWNVIWEEPSKEELKVLHTAIKKVNEDIERLSFNTCVSAFMVAVNELKKLRPCKGAVLRELVLLIAPFAPHIAEELWQRLGGEGSIHLLGKYPKANEDYLQEDAIEYPLAINGKTRGTHAFPAGASREELEKAALELEVVRKWINGKTVRKVIVVPKRMINIVVG